MVPRDAIPQLSERRKESAEGLAAIILWWENIVGLRSPAEPIVRRLLAGGDWIRTSSTRARSIWWSPLLCRRKLGTSRCALSARRPASKRRGPDRRGRNPCRRRKAPNFAWSGKKTAATLYRVTARYRSACGICALPWLRVTYDQHLHRNRRLSNRDGISAKIYDQVQQD